MYDVQFRINEAQLRRYASVTPTIRQKSRSSIFPRERGRPYYYNIRIIYYQRAAVFVIYVFFYSYIFDASHKRVRRTFRKTVSETVSNMAPYNEQ